jgi:hypothetical protein
MADLQQHVDLFTLTAERDADGYATGFHAGVAAIRRNIGREILQLRHNPPRMVEACLRLVSDDVITGNLPVELNP